MLSDYREHDTTDTLQRVYSCEQVRELEHLAIHEHGIASLGLMQAAGAAAFASIQKYYADSLSMLLVCGAGNNAGDGYIVAELARQAGMQVNVFALLEPALLRGDALLAAQAFCQQAEVSLELSASDIAAADIIVDACLGTGLDREISGDYFQLIERLNNAAAPIIALDVPSGLHANTGMIMGTAIQASLTVTFIGLKQGLLTAHGPDCTGQLLLAELDIPAAVFSQVPVHKYVLGDAIRGQRLPARRRSAHKGEQGHVLIVGGDDGYLGAACLAARAAGRAGAGLVTVATRPEHAHSLAIQAPELMTVAVADALDMQAVLQRVDCVVIGPGLGQSDWAVQLFAAVLQTKLPLLVDADALNLLAQQENSQRDNWILTPHPGEAARLLARNTQTIQQDRFQAITELQRRYGGVVVLKGVGSLIQAGEDVTYMCDKGNPGMATAGMGDVLSGVIAGLLAQGLTLLDAANTGVFIHAQAADLAAEKGERGLLASDLLPHIRTLVNP